MTQQHADLEALGLRSLEEWGKDPLVCHHLQHVNDLSTKSAAYLYMGMLGCDACFRLWAEFVDDAEIPFECVNCGTMTSVAHRGTLAGSWLGSSAACAVILLCEECDVT